MEWLLCISLYLLSASQSGVGFNVDPAAWKVFTSPAAGFGYRVIQKDQPSLFVSAPLEQRRDKRGRVYQCQVQSAACSPLSINGKSAGNLRACGGPQRCDVQAHTHGHVLASINHCPTALWVCGPTITKECESITTVSGMCFKVRGNGAVTGPFPGSLRDCPLPPAQTDIAFLLDGSGSVRESDFTRMKNFVTTLIENVITRNTQFAIAQYSHECEIHVNFNDFNTHSWKSQVANIIQMKQWTNTAAAIDKLVRELFTASAGARPNANRILLVITDGQSNDAKRLSEVAEQAKSKNIIRYAIGVGGAFGSSSAQQELNTIASDPDNDYVFRVDNFQALNNIKDKLKENIIAIEGTQTSGDSTHMELAQDGFSAVLTSSNDLIMGAVGAFQWKGGYQQYLSAGGVPAFQKGSEMEPESYLGYSMAVAKRRENYIIQGAPRYKHRGLVMIFSQSNQPWKLQLDNKQSQIGSYYGAEVCTVDLDSDSMTDLLLVSAPMYIEGDQEGKVFVYHFSGRWPLNAGEALVGVLGERGRFGTSVASLADLNGDGFSEVAVGAPLEDGGQGSVYIFHGKKEGVSTAYSQRIVGSSVGSGLQFFGLTVSQAAVDQSRDALPDVAVGSKGAVLLLRSRPIVSVETTVSYTPSKIPTSDSDSGCKPLRNTAKVCFTMTPKHTGNNRALEANIKYTLTLDAFRQKLFRATFTAEDRVLQNMTRLQDNLCVSHEFTIKGCLEDALNPLSNELSFTFEGRQSAEKLSPILQPQTKTTAYHPLNFEIDCGTDNICEDELKVDFSFGSSDIKVGIELEMNVSVSVENRGENSYNTDVTLSYPAGLSYRKFTMNQGRVECDSQDTEDGSKPEETVCHINKPIFKSNAKALFVVSFGIDGTRSFDQMVTFKATAASGNDKHSAHSEASQEKRIAVKYSMFAVIKRLENTTNSINFTAGKSNVAKPVMQMFEVENLLRGLNLTVIIQVPIKLGDKDIWMDVNTIQIPGCDRDPDQEPANRHFVDKLKKKPVVDCSVAVCRVFKCRVHMMRNDKSIYTVSGDVSSGWIEQTGPGSAQFDLVTTATLDYDRNTYIYASSESPNTPPSKTIETHVEVYEEANFTKEIIGGVVGGLLLLALITAGLYKAGFFNSQYKQMLEEAGEGAGGAGEGAGGPAN